MEEISAEVLAQLIGEMHAPPRVYAYELARELGCAEGTLSKFLNGRTARPTREVSVQQFRSALAALKRRKGVAA